MNRILSWEITSESNYRNRRQFLRDAGVAIGQGLLAASQSGRKPRQRPDQRVMVADVTAFTAG
jgi:hypothetical protein